jgi:Predicted AAA-ATPase/PD-(D/E)XK nuclease superfamily
MLKIPYGRADFGAIRREHCFYIDRTNYIEQLEAYAPVYTMFLRPRRFGKSLFISILEHYYDFQKANDFQQLFGNLNIGQNPTSLANQFMILRFDFSGIETNDLQKVHDAFLAKVKSGFKNFMSRYPGSFTPEQQTSILSQKLATGVALDFFGCYYENHLQQKIYLLIDEYDQFTNELLSFHFHDFKNIVSKNGYVRKFYEVLKEEAMVGNIARIFMTGVAPVTVDSMTSGFNIVTDISLHPRFHDLMGFVETEVLDLLVKIDLPVMQIPQTMTDLRNWYDGYRFNMKANQHLYNPEMVLYFANYFQSEREYPIEMLTPNIASDYKKIANIFRIGGDESIALSHLNYLLENGEVKSYLTKKFNVEVGFGITEIWSMLFFMGMTTLKAASGNNYTFQMPNYVIKSLYYDYFISLQLGMAYGNLRYEIRDAIEELVWHGRIERFTKYVEQALIRAHSNRDSVSYGEKHLKTLMVGLLFPYESYFIRSEMEIHKKYVDIFLERIPQVDIPHEILLELKYVKKEDAEKWLDKDGKLVDPPASAKPAKKVAKPRKTKVVALPVPVAIPVKPLLEDVCEKGAIQLAEYMEMPRFQRPNLLGFCLVYVGNECYKILPYQKK